MFVTIWEYQVKAEYAAEFENIYSASGAWTQLFSKANGYLGTELLHDPNTAHRYITIDRWESSRHYASFKLQWEKEYAELDVRCEGLTETERHLGTWESVVPAAR